MRLVTHVHVCCRLSHECFSNALERTSQGQAISLMLSEQVMLVGKLQAAAKEATRQKRQNISTKVGVVR